MDEDLIAKLAKNAKAYSSQMVQPAYSGISTFFKVPSIDEIKDIDIALAGATMMFEILCLAAGSQAPAGSQP